MNNKEILFSVTAADCDFDYTKGSGAGGQKRNKTSNAVRCTHRDSGAVGYSEDTRSQHDNKRIAFRRMSETTIFKSWHKTEVARRLGTLQEIEEKLDKEIKRVIVEGKDEDGRWTKID